MSTIFTKANIMSSVSLTSKYRPQTFQDVAGQKTLKAILSRTALEDRVAPAYLFSGTRGVGKTTIARIFAKALNCRKAPTNEPCNECDQCKAVTLGNSVDVVEIDGASNRGIDDVRRLKEVVGYAPMEGRYKVFIIDEAHMLSREAFNALLKTLEEPPAHVTFIMATTEPHKFPATIISRCQHYVFKRLPESELVTHLTSVLNKENISFEKNAISLIARRGAGSVRDSMSILSQVLALGEQELTEAIVRDVLGLAGNEAFLSIVYAMQKGDSIPLIKILHDLLDQGLDISFFLRELGAFWRNLFVLRQSGNAGLIAVDLPEAEASKLLELSQSFSLAHIHACWQMTLEGQRRILASLEPGVALELLLLNLAMLPQLIPLDSIPQPNQKTLATGRSQSQQPQTKTTALQKTTTEATFCEKSQQEKIKNIQNQAPRSPSTFTSDESNFVKPDPALPEKEDLFPKKVQKESVPLKEETKDYPMNHPSWSDIIENCTTRELPGWFIPLSKDITINWEENILQLRPKDAFTAQRIMEENAKIILESALMELCGKIPHISILEPTRKKASHNDLREKILNNPSIKALEKTFDARIIDFGQIHR